MHRYEELEKLYYKKKYLKIIFFIFLTLIVFGAVYYVVVYKKSVKSKKEITKSKKIVKKETVKKVKQETNESNVSKTASAEKIKKPNKVNNEQKQNNQKLMFILPKIDNNMVKNSSIADKTQKTIKKQPSNKVKTNKPKKIKPQPKTEEKEPVIQEKKVSVSELIRKFNLNPDYDLAMLIAKEYYNRGDLNNARIWVIKANNLNPEDVESWLLFADILVKKNEKQKALKILNVYIDTYGDNPLIEAKIRSINE